MLQTDTQKKFNTLLTDLTGSNCSPFELYAEHFLKSQTTFDLQQSKTTSFCGGGLQLLYSENEVPKSYVSSCLQDTPLDTWLRNAATQSPSVKASIESLERVCRNFGSRLSKSILFSASFNYCSKNFIFSSDRKELSPGFENYFNCSFEVSTKKGNQIFSLKRSFTRHDPHLALKDATDFLFSPEELDKLILRPWPAPKGRLSVLWSEKAMAKWVLLLLQLLSKDSRKQTEPFRLIDKISPLSFQVLDNWKPEIGFDSEGNPRQETLLIDLSGDFSPFDHLRGFSRRASHTDFPVTAPWHPACVAHQKSSDLLADTKEGISIQEFDIIGFDPLTYQVRLKVGRAYLIHDGKEGEPIAPTEWTISFLEVLESLCIFSDTLLSHPMTWSTPQQELFIEINAPKGLSQELEFPGSVPLSHYW